MNRSLALFLATAAVVGATGGTLAAVSLTGDGTGRAASPGSRPEVGPGRAGDVLWANERVLHDGDLEVDLALDAPPSFLQRAAGGWVVGTPLHTEGEVSQVSFVAPDGAVTPIAEVDGYGDVSPDGSRFVGLRAGGSEDDQGYAVWDLATGEQVDEVTSGRTESQRPTGTAQFLDDVALATGWSPDATRVDEQVVRSGFAEDDGVQVLTEIDGPWTVSPDGRWVAGSDPTQDTTCAQVVSLEGLPVAATCDSFFDGRPSFAVDSSAVLAVPGGTEGVRPGSFVPVPTGSLPARGAVAAPELGLRGVFLDESRVVVLGPQTPDGDGTTISVCDQDGCEETYRGGDAAVTAVLGTSY